MNSWKQQGSRCQTVLVEKTDRLYRNLKDYTKVEDLRIEIHLVKENEIINSRSGASANLVHGFKVLMARNYSQNLGEETKKGMTQKARNGLYPSFAPPGYHNTEGPNGKRIIVPDSDAPTITRLFEEFATGDYSLKTLAAMARKGGWTVRGNQLAVSTLHQILRKRIYTGAFDWNGTIYSGSHVPLVSQASWDKVQSLLDRRIATRRHRIKRDFAYSGFIRCGHCGCQLVGELKKARYVYYHCTGYRGKCGEPYARETAIEEQFNALLQDLTIPPEVLQWLQEEVAGSDQTEQAAREREIAQLVRQQRRIDASLDAMYDDRLDGRITAEMYDRKARDLGATREQLVRRMEEIRNAEAAPVNEVIDLMDLTSRAAELFRTRPVAEKQGFLRLVMKSAQWQCGELQIEFESPFENLKLSNQLTHRKYEENRPMKLETEIWLLR